MMAVSVFNLARHGTHALSANFPGFGLKDIGAAALADAIAEAGIKWKIVVGVGLLFGRLYQTAGRPLYAGDHLGPRRPSLLRLRP